MKKRIEYIDIAKAIGIVLVIIGHIVPSDSECKRIIYSFHMPLFFLISGMTLKPYERLKFVDIKFRFLSKTNGILIPYILWGLIYSSLSIKNLLLIMYGTRETLLLAGSLSSLWYLTVMFVSVIISEIVVSIVKGNNSYIFKITAIFAFMIIGFTFPHIPNYGVVFGLDIAFVAVSYMLIGNLIRIYFDCFVKLKHLVFLFIIFVVAFGYCIKYSTSSYGYVLMANAEYGNRIWFVINAILGIIIVLIISYSISKINCISKLFTYIGRRTLGVFLVHKIIIELLFKLSWKFNIDVNNFICTILLTFLCLICSLIVVIVVEKLMPELIGLKKRGIK